MAQSKRMVRVKHTVTVTSEIPVEYYSTGHTPKDNGVQMSDDEIRDFEMRANAEDKDRKFELSEALLEAIQTQPEENQDWMVTVEFFDKED